MTYANRIINFLFHVWIPLNHRFSHLNRCICTTKLGLCLRTPYWLPHSFMHSMGIRLTRIIAFLSVFDNSPNNIYSSQLELIWYPPHLQLQGICFKSRHLYCPIFHHCNHNLILSPIQNLLSHCHLTTESRITFPWRPYFSVECLLICLLHLCTILGLFFCILFLEFTCWGPIFVNMKSSHVCVNGTAKCKH